MREDGIMQGAKGCSSLYSYHSQVGLALILVAAMALGPGLTSAMAQERQGIRWSWVRLPACPPRSCWQIRITAESTTCPHGLYVALNQWTQSDLNSPTNTFLAETTALLPQLRKGESAIITFPRSARTSQGASISEINCY